MAATGGVVLHPCTEVTGQRLQEVKKWLSAATERWRQAVRLEGVWVFYYLNQTLFHMSTHLLLTPSQGGTAQRTYLAPILRLPPLHFSYTGWKWEEKQMEEKVNNCWVIPKMLKSRRSFRFLSHNIKGTLEYSIWVTHCSNIMLRRCPEVHPHFYLI